MKRKVKMIMEYSTAGYMPNWDTISRNDLKDKITVSVFLKDGSRINSDSIDKITIKAR